MASIVAQRGSGSRGNVWIAIAAVALGIITAALVINYLRSQEGERRALTDASVPVVVAARDIPLGAHITSGMLEVKRVTPDAAVAAAYAETAQVVGLRARAAISSGAQVVPAMVVQSGSGDALSFVVPPGKRAVAITGSNVIGGGGHIRPGDFVDVMVTVEAWKLDGTPDQNNNKRPKGVYTILQNVEVLAVSDAAQKIAESGPDPKEKKETDSTSLDRSDNKSVTLAVEPSQAQLLFLAESEGKIRLALRPFGERDEQSVAPVVEPILAPAPTARPAGR
jgi:pilus assembly protein CpaB